MNQNEIIESVILMHLQFCSEELLGIEKSCEFWSENIKTVEDLRHVHRYDDRISYTVDDEKAEIISNLIKHAMIYKKVAENCRRHGKSFNNSEIVRLLGLCDDTPNINKFNIMLEEIYRN